MSRKDSHHHGNLSCSFCGKGQREVRKLIAGPTVYICDECIKLCNDIIAEESEREENRPAVASAMANGTFNMRASVCASSVLPHPVGPISRMFDFANSTSASGLAPNWMRL